MQRSGRIRLAQQGLQAADEDPVPGQERRAAVHILVGRVRVLMNVLLLIPVRDAIGVQKLRVGVQRDEGVPQPRPLPSGDLGGVAADSIPMRHLCPPRPVDQPIAWAEPWSPMRVHSYRAPGTHADTCAGPIHRLKSRRSRPPAVQPKALPALAKGSQARPRGGRAATGRTAPSIPMIRRPAHRLTASLLSAASNSPVAADRSRAYPFAAPITGFRMRAARSGWQRIVRTGPLGAEPGRSAENDAGQPRC